MWAARSDSRILDRTIRCVIGDFSAFFQMKVWNTIRNLMNHIWGTHSQISKALVDRNRETTTLSWRQRPGHWGARPEDMGMGRAKDFSTFSTLYKHEPFTGKALDVSQRFVIRRNWLMIGRERIFHIGADSDQNSRQRAEISTNFSQSFKKGSRSWIVTFHLRYLNII